MKNRLTAQLLLGIALGFGLSTVIYVVLDLTTGIVQSIISEQITSIVMLIAAGMALYGIFTQIQSNINTSEKNRAAKLEAAKSVLPIVLSNISQICEERYIAIAHGRKGPEIGSRWEMTDTELSTLKECIEFSGDPEKKLMLRICRIYQVLIFRWNDLKLEDLFSAESLSQNNTNHSEPNLRLVRIQKRKRQFHAMGSWAVLQATAASLFNYSRGAPSNPTNDEIVALALSILCQVNTETLTEKDGCYLKSRADYKEFLTEMENGQNLEFVNDDWHVEILR